MLIVISESTFLPGEAGIVNDLFHSGLDLFHIRKYDADETEIEAFIRDINPEFRKKLVVNHHHELGTSLGISRFHYSERDRKSLEEMNWHGITDGSIYSTSIHSMEEFNNLTPHFSYAFLSPVFDSISKAGYKAVTFDLEKRTNHQAKLVALGGIHAGNVQEVFRLGFDGAALLGSIWNSKNPVESFVETRLAVSQQKFL